MTILDFLFFSLKAMLPLLCAAFAGLWSERSGVINIALEGMMLLGAFAAGCGAAWFESPTYGLLLTLAVGIVCGLTYGLMTVGLKMNQIIAGTALNLFAMGITPLLCNIMFGRTGGTPSLPIEHRLEWSGYGIVTLITTLTFYLYHFTPFGLSIQFAGEKPEALGSAGRSITRNRLLAVTLSGVFAAFGGALLSLFLSSSFVRNISAGRGFIALAALIAGKWKPLPTLFSCFFFGCLEIVPLLLQDGKWMGITIPSHVIQSFPYVVTLIIMAGLFGKMRAPAALGKS